MRRATARSEERRTDESAGHERERAAEVDRTPSRALPRAAVVGAVAVALALAGVLAWALLRDDQAEPEARPPIAARITTLDELRELAATEGPFYWVGPRVGMQYEFARTADDRVFVRYLPAGVEVGAEGGRYLTVATYRVEDAFEATRRAGQADGGVVRAVRGGGIAAYNKGTSTSVYLAFPGVDRQIEIFDPSPARARRLAFSGAVVPILPERGATPEERGEPVEATRARLAQLAAETDHPVYWLGEMPGRKFELTRLPNGEIYIRYLPSDIAIGDYRARWPAVGTFPVEDAVRALDTEAERIGAVTFRLDGGGLAYYHETSPKNVHFAFPGADVEVEVYHPTPGRAQQLVRSRRVVAIP